MKIIDERNVKTKQNNKKRQKKTRRDRRCSERVRAKFCCNSAINM